MHSIGPMPPEKAGRHYVYHERSLKPDLTFPLPLTREHPGQVSVVQGSLCFSGWHILFKWEKRKPRKDSP